MAFMSSSNNNTSSTNRAINTAQTVNIAHRVSTASTQVNDAYSTNINNLSDVVIYEFVNKPVAENCIVMSSEEEPKVVRKCDDDPKIKEWVLDDEEENVSQPKIIKKTVRPSIVKKEFVKSKQQENPARKNC
ncbi:hypothetical protein Tco_1042569 [Tanacetum coccineum]|uniref:Uncharacterized protein n=1 Tax=Tanacetum coccineum TaxID=301880 RepID=A0ABQ5GKX2_9ASTR